MELLSIIEFRYFWLMRSLLLLVILGALLNEEGIFLVARETGCNDYELSSYEQC